MLPSNELHGVSRKKHKDPRGPLPPSGYETSDTVVSDGDRDRYVPYGSANNNSIPRSGRGAQSDNELTARDLAIIAAQRQRHALQHQQHQQQMDMTPALQVPRPSRPHRHSSGLSGSFSALALSQEDSAAQRKPALGPPRHSMFEMSHEDAGSKDKMSRTQQRLQHARDLPMLPVLNHSSHSQAHGPASAEQVLSLPLNSSGARAVHIGQHTHAINNNSYHSNSALAMQQQIQQQQQQQQQQGPVSSRHARKLSTGTMSEDETLSRASSDPLSPMGQLDSSGRRPSGGANSSNMPRIGVRNLPPLPSQLNAISPRQFPPNASASVYSPLTAPLPFSPYVQAFGGDRPEVSSPLPPTDPAYARPLPLGRQQSRVHYSTEPEADFSDRSSDVCGNPNCHCTPSPRPYGHAGSPQFPLAPPQTQSQSQYPHHPRAPVTPQQFHPSPPPPPHPSHYPQNQGVLLGIDTPPPMPPRAIQHVRQRSGSVVSVGMSEAAPPLSPQPYEPVPTHQPHESMGMSTTDWMQLLKNYRTKASETSAPPPATAAS